MIARDGFTLIELTLAVVILGVLFAVAMPNYIAMQARAKEADVMALAHVVQIAAEDHAARNDGIYSDQGADLLPCLPGGELQENPFTGQATEPKFGMPAAIPGQVGIVVYLHEGVQAGYTITGFGKTELLIRYTGGH
jgi:prepilin-type N-terminal cleavage/methylation domain-containing protein